MFFVFVSEVFQSFFDFDVEYFYAFLPLYGEKIHLCHMCFMKLLKFFLMLHPVIFHLPIFKLFLQGFYFTFECLCLNVLSFGLALLLPSDSLFSWWITEYINSQSWLKSRSLPSVLILCSAFVLGERTIFFAVVGRL